MQGGCGWKQRAGGYNNGILCDSGSGHFSTVSPDKRALTEFVGVEGGPREVRQEGLVRGRHPWGAFPLPSLGGGMEPCLQYWPRRVQAEQNQSAQGRWLISEVLPASRLDSGA